MPKVFRPHPESFKNTFCVFREVAVSEVANREPDFTSSSGSRYFYTEKGMYRLANHWGRLANSKWRLVSQMESEGKIKLGYANWSEFYPDNDIEKLYYLEADFEKGTILYQHKNNPEYDGKAVLWDTSETKKRLRQARNILTLTNWASYFENDAIEMLRKTIITELIYTRKTLDEIKRDAQ
ncbi:hypothetical protein [Flavobacterium humi]|uniref:Uncharacterized protein n=1 Tax=Flavobacterium humi TaxID=2562683 RepID=A0A4Z0L5Y0_9FLAO|nr:hypothetical protein [Flavobacterium humi]TGD56566.1 hypothetical protein E4635_15400 [Flavobacterium humi]